MATETTVILSDSLDERIKTGVETVTFFHPMTGQKMEIELGEANRKHFSNKLAALDKYFEAAEVPVAPSKPKAAVKSDENTKIREWARENGFTIGDRGRIKAEIVAAYTAAHENLGTVEQAETVVEDSDSALAVALLASDPAEVAASLNETEQTASELSDAEIMQLMAEIESESGEPASLEALTAKVDEVTNNE